jgi:hypothetical protein
MTQESKNPEQTEETQEQPEPFTAQDLDAASRGVLAAGASDLTEGLDALRASEYMAQLSQTVAAAGVLDVAEGVELIAMSDDIEALGAVVGLMSEDDLEQGMELARMAGELWTASDVVALLDMPVLATFLEQRGEWLQEIAVDIILRAGSTSALAQAMGETGARVADLGAQEVTEGLVREAASSALATDSETLAEAGRDLAAKGLVETAVAEAAAAAARELSTGAAPKETDDEPGE